MNLALSDEQEFLREAARGALSRVKTLEAAREALEGTALPDLWPTMVEAGWPGLLIDEDRGGAGLGAFDAMLVAQECGRVLAGAPLLGLLPASGLLQARRRRGAGGGGGGRCAPGVAARAPARRPRRGLDRRPAQRQAPPARAARDGRRRRRELHRRGRLGARRSRCRPAGRRRGRRARRRGRGRGRGERGEHRGRHALRRHPLARARHARRRGRPAPARQRGAAGAGVVPGSGAARGRVAGSGRDRAGDGRAVRQGALHLRPRHRLLPGHQARAHRGPAPPGERTLAAVLRGLGLRRPPRASSRWPPARRARRPARRSTSPRARTSSPTAGSARPGSTTPRCSSAAPSSAAGCWAGRATRRTAWRRSCSRRPDVGGAGDATDRVAAEQLAAA